ncbi:hypothetical protein GTA09_29315 [Rhodococcus hoagii]|nr:hypothetical protein [Prescottella equi]
MIRRRHRAPHEPDDDTEGAEGSPDVRYPQPSPLEPWWRRVMAQGKAADDRPEHGDDAAERPGRRLFTPKV